jgi:hypothetical protein
MCGPRGDGRCGWCLWRRRRRRPPLRPTGNKQHTRLHVCELALSPPPAPCGCLPQVALLRNYTNGLTALVANLKSQKPLGKQVQHAQS